MEWSFSDFSGMAVCEWGHRLAMQFVAKVALDRCQTINSFQSSLDTSPFIGRLCGSRLAVAYYCCSLKTVKVDPPYEHFEHPAHISSSWTFAGNSHGPLLSFPIPYRACLSPI